jgi:hypothetical protein
MSKRGIISNHFQSSKLVALYTINVVVVVVVVISPHLFLTIIVFIFSTSLHLYVHTLVIASRLSGSASTCTHPIPLTYMVQLIILRAC